MKLTNETLNIFKMFSAINQGVVFKPGRTQTTCSPQNTLLCRVVLDQDIEERFAVYNLSEFINILGLFEEPEIDFSEKNFLVISDDNQKVRYKVASENVIHTPPYDEIELGEGINLKLPKEVFKRVKKSCNILQVPNIILRCENGKITIQTEDLKGDPGNTYISNSIGEHDSDFKVIFKEENLQLEPSDFDVTIDPEKQVCKFVNDQGNITYFIAIESMSEF